MQSLPCYRPVVQACNNFVTRRPGTAADLLVTSRLSPGGSPGNRLDQMPTAGQERTRVGVLIDSLSPSADVLWTDFGDGSCAHLAHYH
jgi:hypothetical protein